MRNWHVDMTLEPVGGDNWHWTATLKVDGKEHSKRVGDCITTLAATSAISVAAERLIAAYEAEQGTR